MGTWGYGVFDGDSECAYLGNLVSRIRESIETDLVAMVREAVDKRVRRRDRPVLAGVAILSALARAIPYTKHCVSKQDVKRWRHSYWSWFDVAMTNEPHCDEFRRTANREFRALLRLAHEDDEQ